MVELKPATTYEEQLQILKNRGVFISDETFCLQKLEEINYYRLTAYFLPFRTHENTYRPGTSFHTVYRIYDFDRKMRRLLFSAIEEVEVYLRAKFAYYYAHKYSSDSFKYHDPSEPDQYKEYPILENWDLSHFSKNLKPEKFQKDLDWDIYHNRKTPFVRHHIEHYDGCFPIWVLVEIFSFGKLSCFYSDLLTSDKKSLARTLYHTTHGNLSSWLRCITDLRNICAHYGRLYYRRLPAIPAGLDIPEQDKRRLWGAVLALKELYPNRDKWNSEFLPAMEALITEYHGDINLRCIGFPDNWDIQLKK